MIIVGQVLIYSILLGLALWGMKHAISLYVFSRRKEEINKLQARISILKLHLKGKIKRKCNKIEEAFRKEQDSDTLALLHPNLSKIAGLGFALPADYQSLISSLSVITEVITDHIKIKHRALIKMQEARTDEATSATNTEDDKIRVKCKKLVKYDKAHMLIIVEIIQATEKVIDKINEYNVLVEFNKKQKKIKLIPDKIQIEHYSVIVDLVEQVKKSNIDIPDFQILGKDSLGDSAELNEKKAK